MDDVLKTIPHELLWALIDNPYESLILVDREGIVRFMSSSNDGVYPVPVKEAVGRHINEVSPTTGLSRVLETGRAEIGRGMTLKKASRVVSRIPLVKDGRVIGAVGKLMLTDPGKLKELYEHIETLEKNLDYYKEELSQAYGIRYSFANIIGATEPIQRAKALARQAAQSDASVIITGESGTGKELFAHAIHQAGKRRRHNFVRVNCAAIPADLIEAEFFGYEPGAFTGAHKKGRAGKFELADRGTIFLDEIGDMPMTLQVKLMRVLQEKEVERLGGQRPKRVDFRIISATNRDILKLIQTKEFRLDLYYRLNVIHIPLPPLRQIKADIPAIFRRFLDELSPGREPKIRHISDQAMAALTGYSWPGNFRELRNLAERMLIVCEGDRLKLADLPQVMHGRHGETSSSPSPAGHLKELLEETERTAIMRALEKSGQNRAEAARILGIHRTGLYQKMNKYNLP